MTTTFLIIVVIVGTIALLLLTGMITVQHPCSHEECEAWATHVVPDALLEREDGTIIEGKVYQCGQHADHDAILISDDQKP